MSLNSRIANRFRVFPVLGCLLLFAAAPVPAVSGEQNLAPQFPEVGIPSSISSQGLAPEGWIRENRYLDPASQPAYRELPHYSRSCAAAPGTPRSGDDDLDRGGSDEERNVCLPGWNQKYDGSCVQCTGSSNWNRDHRQCETCGANQYFRSASPAGCRTNVVCQGSHLHSVSGGCYCKDAYHYHPRTSGYKVSKNTYQIYAVSYTGAASCHRAPTNAACPAGQYRKYHNLGSHAKPFMSAYKWAAGYRWVSTDNCVPHQTASRVCAWSHGDSNYVFDGKYGGASGANYGRCVQMACSTGYRHSHQSDGSVICARIYVPSPARPTPRDCGCGVWTGSYCDLNTAACSGGNSGPGGNQ